MPQTRTREVYQDGVLVGTETYQVSDAEASAETERRDISAWLLQGRVALNNWPALTPAQKDALLKALLRYVLWRES